MRLQCLLAAMTAWLAPGANAAQQDSTRGGGVLEPLSVTAVAARGSELGPSELRGSRPGFSLDEAAGRIPGFSAQPRGSFSLDTRLIVRGSGARSPFGVRGVTVLLDGVPQTLPDGQANLSQLDPGSLERFEVSRGAAAALYGNAAGGVISAFSPSPWGAPLVRLRLTAGGSGSVAGSFVARARRGTGGAVLTASRSSQDGWRDHAAGELRQLSLSGGMGAGAWRLGTRVRVSDLARADNPGALDSAQFATNPRQAQGRNVAFGAGKRAREWQGSVDARRDGERGSVSAVAWLLTRDLDNPLATGWVRLDRLVTGLRLAAVRDLRGAVRLQAGFDAQRLSDDRLNFDNDSGVIGTVARVDQRELVGSHGLRASATTLTPLAATLAVRYDRVTFEVSDKLLTDGDASGRRRMDAASFAAGLARNAGPWRAHASLSSSFETPTTTELARPGTGGFNPSLQPQRGIQAEAGVRYTAGPLSGSATAYRSNSRDALVPREDTLAPGRFLFVNAARARLYGIEVEGELLLNEWLAVAASGTVADHRYTRFPTDSTPLDGRRIPGLPRHSAWLSISAGRASGIQAAAELVHSGRSFADDANSASASPWTMVHVRASWRGSRVTAYGGVRNAFDARAVGSLNVNGALRRFFEPASGRTVYVGLEAYLYR